MVHHPHPHSGHSHGPGAHGVHDEARLRLAFFVIALFMLVEVVGGLWSGSLALLADAGHMVSDAAALGFSWYAVRTARRRPTRQLSYGFRRMEVLAAFVNGSALFAVAAWIVLEAVQRLFHPVDVLGGTMFWVALAGLAANVVALRILAGGAHSGLNVHSAWLHVLGDLLGSIAALAAALVIMRTGWMAIDPLLSVLIALIIARSAWPVVRSAAHILLEGAPADLDTARVRDDLLAHVAQVADVHHVHVWSLSSDAHLATLHAVATPGVEAQALIDAIGARLLERFGIAHVTVQVEPAPCGEPAAEQGAAGSDGAGPDATGADSPVVHGASAP